MTNEIEVITQVIKEVAPKVIERLLKALDVMVSDFEVNGGGMGTYFIEERGMHPFRLGGTISLDVLPGSWGGYQPCTSRHKSDHPTHAGRYVLRGVRIKVTVGLPAVNEDSLEVSDYLAKAMQFTQIMRSAERYFTDLLQLRVVSIGEMFLSQEEPK